MFAAPTFNGEMNYSLINRFSTLPALIDVTCPNFGMECFQTIQNLNFLQFLIVVGHEVYTAHQ